MAGSTFLAGEQKIRPGVYVRVTSSAEAPAAAVPQGIVAALFRASWGPLGQAVALEGPDSVEATYGTGNTTHVVSEAFRGGCRQVVAYRLGTGGATATGQLQDTTTPTPVAVVRIDAKYSGTRGNSLALTLRDSLVDPAKRELLVYEGTTLRQSITFAKGGSEPQALVNAVSGSSWITATLLAAGNNTLATTSQQALSGGADATVASADYSTALSSIEALDWNVLAIDSEDVTIHTTVQAYIDRVRGEGKRVMAIVGEPTSVSFAARIANAKALNRESLVYVANGWKGTDGVTREGYRAAARIAGMVAAAPVSESLTHVTISGASELVGGLTNSQIEQAIGSGACVFSLNGLKQVQIEYGITTLTTLGANQDAGWKKIRRVRTRDNLMERIAATVDPLIGRVANSPDGRATLIAAMQGVVNAMVREGALLGGAVAEDKANLASGDAAWFVIQVDDLDSAEKVYLTFGFRFSPPAAA